MNYTKRIILLLSALVFALTACERSAPEAETSAALTSGQTAAQSSPPESTAVETSARQSALGVAAWAQVTFRTQGKQLLVRDYAQSGDFVFIFCEHDEKSDGSGSALALYRYDYRDMTLAHIGEYDIFNYSLLSPNEICGLSMEDGGFPFVFRLTISDDGTAAASSEDFYSPLDGGFGCGPSADSDDYAPPLARSAMVMPSSALIRLSHDGEAAVAVGYDADNDFITLTIGRAGLYSGFELRSSEDKSLINGLEWRRSSEGTMFRFAITENAHYYCLWQYLTNTGECLVNIKFTSVRPDYGCDLASSGFTPYD